MKVLPISVATPKFKGGEYENPINRKTERKLAILGSIGGSVAVGVIGGGLATVFTNSRNYKLPAVVGAAVAAIGLALTLPSALYKAKVGSFAREKEMEVFSRERAASSNIFDGLNQQIKSDDVPLEQKINNYMKVQAGNKGTGTVIVQ